MRAFDQLFAEAVPLITQGLHQRDTPPIEGGRWPVSVVLPADQASATRLEREMAEVEVLAGPGHFRTGIAGSMHVTVRALEGYRHAAAQDDEVVQRYANLVHFAADIAEPAGLIEWVAARRQLNLGRLVLDTAELWRFHYEDGTDGRVMRPAVMARTRMGRRWGSPATKVVGTSNPH